jgi:hypothetical protein
VSHHSKVLTAAAIGMGMMLGSLPAAARNGEAAAEPVTAIWRQHRIAFEYHGSSVRYSCSGLQKKVGSILKAMGAHDDVAVEVNCASDALTSSASMRVTLKIPVVASEANVRAVTTYTAQQELVARLHGVPLPTATDLHRFDAVWRSVSLTRNRKLRLSSGDCDLLTGVHTQLLPKLGIVTQDFHCYDGSRRTRPKFQVMALLPIEPPMAGVIAGSGHRESLLESELLPLSHVDSSQCCYWPPASTSL